MRKDYVYSRRSGGFIKKQTRQGVNYDDFTDEWWALLIAFFRYYPDYLEDVTENPNCKYHNSLIGRIMRRAMVRYRMVSIIGSRGTTKTSAVISSASNKGILYPGEVMAYYGPTNKQTAKIASEAWHEYGYNYPYLAKHWTVNNDSAETFKISTAAGSAVEVAIDRGRNTHCVIGEECGQEDGNAPFDWSDFNQVVKATNRLQYLIDGEPDRSHQDLAEIYITSASSKENHAYGVYIKARKKMADGENAFACAIPWQVPVLCHVRPFEYYDGLRDTLSKEEFMRECESKCTGSADNPVLQDQYVQDAKTLSVMEDRHCGDPNVRYYIGYDVSYRQRNGNAMCAEAVFKVYEQRGSTSFKKDCVYITDLPPLDAERQARRIKNRWAQYRMQGAPEPIIVIDSWQFGEAVVQQLHRDLDDGLPPLCTVNNDDRYSDLVQQSAAPCIYSLYATSGRGGADPNVDMLDYITREFEHGNVGLLTTNIHEGTKAYKMAHSIKDDTQDVKIQHPYLKTKELCGQIANLRRKKTGSGWTQEEINKHINKDLWSAMMYAARPIKLDEDAFMAAQNQQKSEYQQAAEKLDSAISYAPVRTRSVRRLGRGAIV